jgi:uncharacterized surface protein with fasciclin (FAS1) repeats
MKIRFFRNIVLVLSVIFLLGAFISSCNKTNTPSTPAPGTNSIIAVLQNASDASVFVSGLAKVHLDTVLNGVGPYTVFAPTNDALAASGITTAYFNSLPNDSLKKLMLYHIIGANYTSANLPAGPNAKMIVGSGDSIFITKNVSGIYINGFPLISQDILASNGVVNALSHILLPPMGNIMKTIKSDTLFSYMVAAITRASQGSKNIDSLLSIGGPYTLFVPVNNGFRVAGFATINDINNANADSIANIVLYHILPSRTFTSDMTNTQSRVTLNDSTFMFTSAAGVRQIQDKQNNGAANMLSINVMASNGVLFAIDKVLVP